MRRTPRPPPPKGHSGTQEAAAAAATASTVPVSPRKRMVKEGSRAEQQERRRNIQRMLTRRLTALKTESERRKERKQASSYVPITPSQRWCGLMHQARKCCCAFFIVMLRATVASLKLHFGQQVTHAGHWIMHIIPPMEHWLCRKYAITQCWRQYAVIDSDRKAILGVCEWRYFSCPLAFASVRHSFMLLLEHRCPSFISSQYYARRFP